MYKCTWRIPLLQSPIADSLLPSPFAPLFDPLLLTWNPPSCDRIRPPQSQVACKLTSPDPTLSPPSPFQLPQTPNTPRLTTTTSGINRHLLSGTDLIGANQEDTHSQIHDQRMPYKVRENYHLFFYQYYFLVEHFSNILSTYC
jgi:hypothetical protein